MYRYRLLSIDAQIKVSIQEVTTVTFLNCVSILLVLYRYVSAGLNGNQHLWRLQRLSNHHIKCPTSINQFADINRGSKQLMKQKTYTSLSHWTSKLKIIHILVLYLYQIHTLVSHSYCTKIPANIYLLEVQLVCRKHFSHFTKRGWVSENTWEFGV